MMCFALFYERKYDEAIAFSRRAEELDPRLSLPNCRIKALFEKGDFDAGVAEIQKLPPPAGRSWRMAKLYGSSGPRTLLVTYLQYLTSGPSPETSSPVEIAQAYTALGERDQAFSWLEKAYAHHVSRLTNVNIEPGFDPLRGDPRYDDLLRRIGLPKVPIPKS